MAAVVRLWIQCFVLVTLTAGVQAFVEAETYEWNDVDRVVVVPDVHGAYPALIELLHTTGIINADEHWQAGSAHLVSLGDLLDRGPQSRQVMDLLIRLQSEAVDAGGRVHVVAGNHELMNLIGDLRYVAAEEFNAFSPDETDAMRAAAADPARSYPPGYFAHRQAFRLDGYYGKWLSTLPAVIKVNDTIYAHGGFSPLTATMSLEQLNRQYRATVTSYLSLWSELVSSGLLPDDQEKDAGLLAQSVLADASQSDCLKERADHCATLEQTRMLEEFVELSGSALLDDRGPLWYRGAIYCRPLFEQATLREALANFGATRAVVGHTTTPDARVHSLYDDQLLLLDTGMLVSYYNGRPAVLVNEQGREHVQFLNPSETAQPVRNAFPFAYNRSKSELLDILRLGTIEIADKNDGQQPWTVTVSYQGSRVKATFIPRAANKTANYELAAYRLDQLLGFELVPITLERNIDGTPGALQLNYEKQLTERQRTDSGKPVVGWCSFSRQLNLMHTWDVLIGNSGRTVDNVLYQLPEWRLHVNAHSEAFGSRKRLPGKLKKTSFAIDPSVKTALAGLSRADVEAQLGDLIDDKRIGALMQRRDRLLKLFR